MQTSGGFWSSLSRPQRLLPLLSIVLVVVASVIFWWDGRTRSYIQDDFSYSANILATNALYDASTGQYGADAFTKGRLYYQLQSRSNGAATITGAIDSLSIALPSSTLITQTRTANVDQGRYLSAAPGSKGDEYVFAPRNLQPGQSFRYRYIAYDAPATMLYKGTERLNGLEVYHYVAYYNTKDVIQEKRVTYAYLTSNQGLQYHPNLELWIEPVSGWLVRVVDSTTLTVFDQATGRTVRPHSHYTAYFSAESTRQQTAYAKGLKARVIFDTRIAPRLMLVQFVLLAMICTLALFRRQLVGALTRYHERQKGREQ